MNRNWGIRPHEKFSNYPTLINGDNTKAYTILITHWYSLEFRLEFEVKENEIFMHDLDIQCHPIKINYFHWRSYNWIRRTVR